MALTEEQKSLIKTLKAIGLTNENPQYIKNSENDTEETKSENDEYNLQQSVDQDVFELLSKTIQEDDDFTITTNDIEELDIFFKVYDAEKGNQYRESFAHINLHSASNSEPIFALGSPIMVDTVNGIKMYAGKIIINALSQQSPLIDLCNKYGCSDIYDLPALDLVMMPKNIKEKYLTKYSGIIIQNIKFKDWFFDKSTENPGSFFVITFIASTTVSTNLSTKKNSFKSLQVKNMHDPFTYKYDIEFYDDYFADFSTYINTAFQGEEKEVYRKLYNAINTKITDSGKASFLKACPNIYDIILRYISNT